MKYFLNSENELFAFEDDADPIYYEGMTAITEADAVAIQTTIRPLSADEARRYRNSLLAACDWVMLPDAGVDNLEDWQTYRQALRDVPAQEGFPASVQWPAAPNGIL